VEHRRPGTASSSLVARLDKALEDDDGPPPTLLEVEPLDTADEVLTLLALYDLHLAPLDRRRARWQHHPVTAAVKWRLEERFLARLETPPPSRPLPCRPARAMRALAVTDLVPDVYRYLAATAPLGQIVDFIALEGGPDGAFDDLVAMCQVGVSGEPKLELARNYWDELGNGTLAAVHTELHRRLVAALGIAAVPRPEQPLEALERAVLPALLATNRHLQPELVGALGLTELQAGPRCRRILEGLRRTGAPAGALPFYEVHADVDPRHGRDWIDLVVEPLGADPAWAVGIVRGARWRSATNARFFDVMAARYRAAEPSRQAS
jgi:hypothetical protein